MKKIFELLLLCAIISVIFTFLINSDNYFKNFITSYIMSLIIYFIDKKYLKIKW